MLFDMNHNLIVIQRLANDISAVDTQLSEEILGIPNADSMTMPQLADIANDLMAKRLSTLTDDEGLISYGCYTLTKPENWDAVSYWLCDINKQYVPALKQAKVNHNESTTCT